MREEWRDVGTGQCVTLRSEMIVLLLSRVAVDSYVLMYFMFQVRKDLNVFRIEKWQMFKLDMSNLI